MNKKIAASAAALVALGVASGTAFTDSLNDSVSDKTGAFESATVTGATLDNVDFDYDIAGKNLSQVLLTFDASSGDINNDEVRVTFYDAAEATLGTFTGTVTTLSSTVPVSPNVLTSEIESYSIAVVDTDVYVPPAG